MFQLSYPESQRAYLAEFMKEIVVLASKPVMYTFTNGLSNDLKKNTSCEADNLTVQRV